MNDKKKFVPPMIDDSNVAFLRPLLFRKNVDPKFIEELRKEFPNNVKVQALLDEALSRIEESKKLHLEKGRKESSQLSTEDIEKFKKKNVPMFIDDSRIVFTPEEWEELKKIAKEVAEEEANKK